MGRISKLTDAFYVRHQRRIRRFRALRKQKELKCIKNRTSAAVPEGVFLFSVLHNEMIRMPYFLEYYRGLGVNHFFLIDNNSSDGSGEYLAAQPDVSLWHTDTGYKRAHFGMDWINGLLRRYAQGHWALVVDADEFFIYPYCDSRPIKALTDWLDASAIKSFGAMLLDMYPEGPLDSVEYRSGQNPLEVLTHFDGGNYVQKPNARYGNLWIQGGPRQRAFFADNPAQAPALNKIPLVKWQRGNVYVSSTHTLLPRGLNNTFEEWGGEKICGTLLHTKLLPDLQQKAAREVTRRQHYAGSREYRAYNGASGADIILSHTNSERFQGWKQIEDLGLMSVGGWA